MEWTKPDICEDLELKESDFPVQAGGPPTPLEPLFRVPALVTSPAYLSCPETKQRTERGQETVLPAASPLWPLSPAHLPPKPLRDVQE